MSNPLRKYLAILFACAVSLSAWAAPVIGINMDVSGPTTGSARLSASASYIDAVTSAGGIPVILPPIHDSSSIERHVALCDGFVLTGGRDIDPRRYNETTHPATNLLHPRRENYDFALVTEILKSRKPVLAVCLGCQELNVALGGSLIQDIPTETSSTIDHKPSSDRQEPAHEIAITTGTRLHDLLGTSTLAVNSIHHQSCKAPGKDVVFSATAPDGITEALEVKGHPFAFGVQWHPEALTSDPLHLKIYQGLVDAAEKNAAR